MGEQTPSEKDDQHSTHAECALCCEETLEGLQAKTSGRLREKALTLSAVCVLILLMAHIWFSYIGKILPVPDIVWVVMLAPWCGEGIGKLVSLLKK